MYGDILEMLPSRGMTRIRLPRREQSVSSVLMGVSKSTMTDQMRVLV